MDSDIIFILLSAWLVIALSQLLIGMMEGDRFWPNLWFSLTWPWTFFLVLCIFLVELWKFIWEGK